MGTYSRGTYYDVSGTAGTVLCFHGAGGSGQNWMEEGREKAQFVADLRTAGFSFICPTAKASNGKWNDTNSTKNKDVEAVSQLIRDLLARGPFFAVGHSNGGGFVPRFAVWGNRELAAVQLSNSPGVQQILALPQYFAPTAFCFSQNDPNVDFGKVAASAATLASRGVTVQENDLTAAYAAGGYMHDHQFMNTASTTAAFFGNFS